MSVTIEINALTRRELRLTARYLDIDSAPLALEVYAVDGDFLGEVTLLMNNKELAKSLVAAINAVMDAYSADDAPIRDEEDETESTSNDDA